MATIKDKIKIGELPAGRVELVEEVVEELTIAELQQEIFDIKLRYDTLLNYLKPMMPGEMLVAFGEKKKEIFG